MRVVLDMNVLLSAVFFGGVPGKVLDLWRYERYYLVTSPEILEEYSAAAEELQKKYGSSADFVGNCL